VIDLFAGGGGLSLGASRAGFRVAAAIELDAHAFETHSRNFPGSLHLNQDIGALDGESLLKATGIERGSLDGLIGGPPCQGFSVMGRRNSTDERNDLFGHFFQLVAETQPKFYLAENVPNIMTAGFTQVIAAALVTVKDDYIQLPVLKIKASEYGAPTTRTRVFFIGFRRDLNWDPVLLLNALLPGKDTRKVTVKEALAGLPEVVDENWQTESDGLREVEPPQDSAFGRHLSGRIPAGVGDPVAVKLYQEGRKVYGSMGTRHSKELVARYEILKAGDQDKVSKAVRLDPDGFCPTLRAGTASDKGSYQAVRPIHPKLPRVITPREAARLQGFPDWFAFHRTKWHSFRQIGNSVSPIVAEALLKPLHNLSLEDNSEKVGVMSVEADIVFQ